MSDNNGYVLPESTLHNVELPNRGTQLGRPLLDSAVLGFWPVEELAEQADGPTGRGEVTRAGCLLACYVCVTRSALLPLAESTTSN